ncbi:MAG: hypothetical protein II049_08245 [Clostridia bacterium]|nr:hypothetical protein [Clostridia bacterium]
MQLKIAHFLRTYRDHKKDCRQTYAAVVKKQIAFKQTEYDNLVKNLSAATFAPEIIQDLNNRLKTIKAEIEALETAEPPEEYSTNTILEWLKAISAAPDRRAVQLLVDRIEVSSDKEKTDVNVISTLTSVGELVAARDVLEYAKIHLPILLGTHTSVRRKQSPREVHRFR